METKNIKNLIIDNEVIIPEIQREYVWGNRVDILDKFVSDLDATTQKNINIGFLYRYLPYTDSSNTYNIIDGQQRFTTIILLLIYLSNRDNIELPTYFTNFTYRVRSTSDEFLMQLYSQTKIDFDKIKEYYWWSIQYETDPTIRAIISALKFFKKSELVKKLDFYLIIERVEFWVFDVNSTSQGEELYLSMNSRGEHLETFENIKPLLFKKLTTNSDKLEYGKLWDEWEDFFYTSLDSTNKIKSVDIAMNNFIKIIYELTTGDYLHQGIKPHEHSPNLNLSDINSYFDSFVSVSKWHKEEFSSIYNTDSLLLRVCVAASYKHTDNREEVTRIYRVMRNIILRRGHNSPKEIVSFLSSYISSPTKSFYDFVICEYKNENIFDAHEIDKINLSKAGGEKVEQSFVVAQEFATGCNRVWNGDISALIDWSRTDNSFDIELFNRYVVTFQRAFRKGCDTDSDLIRYVLIAQEFDDYPKRFNSNYSFCVEWWQWRMVLNSGNNINKLKNLLTTILDSDDLSITDRLKALTIMDRAKNWSEFIYRPELMRYCNLREIRWDAEKGWMLIKNHKATTYKWLTEYN